MLPLNNAIRFVKNNLQCGARYYSLQLKQKKSANKMYAWQVHSYNEDPQLSSARIPIITEPSDLLIRVEAASVNPIDTSMKNGYGRSIIGMLRQEDIEFPLTLGRDFAGTVIDKGHEADEKYKIGDLVYGIVPVHKQGSHAENVLVDSSNICHRPKHLSAAESCSILYAAMTAWSALYLSGNLWLRSPRCTKVLILGASGGVGTIAVQMLKSQGATVIGTCATDAIEMVKSLGVDNVYDYTSNNYLHDVASEGRYDIILDCAKIGHENLPNNWNYDNYITLNSNLLKNTDQYGLIPGLALSARDLLIPNFSNSSKGWIKWGFFTDFKMGLDFVDGLLQRKQIVPVIHKVFPFAELPKAYQAMEEGHVRGKIVIDFGDVSDL